MDEYPGMSLEFFTAIIERNEIPHALLLVGSPHSFLATQGKELGTKMIKPRSGASSTLPDLRLIKPEGKIGLHSIQTIRTLCEEAAYPPLESERKCYVIHEADRMLPTSSNALLKTLEEPPPRTLFILLTSYPERLLPTIVSRCRRFTLGNQLAPKTDPLSSHLLDLLPNRFLQTDIQQMGSLIEHEIKEQANTLKSSLSKDLPSLQRETLEKEIDGMLAIQQTERQRALLSLFLEWYRDRWALEYGISDEFLYFPTRKEQLKSTPLIPFPLVEKAVKQALLGLERGLKLSTCLQGLLLQL